MLAAEAGEVFDGIDGAGGDSAGAGGDAEGDAAGGAVGGDGVGEEIEPDAEMFVGGDMAEVLGAEAENRDSLIDAGVDFVGGVEDERGAAGLEAVGARLFAEGVIAGGGEGNEIRHGAAAGEDAAGGGGEAEEIGEPAEDGLFDGVGGGGEVPEIAVLVEGGGDVIGVGGEGVGRGLDVGEEAGVGGVGGVGNDDVFEFFEEGFERLAVLGHRLGFEGAESGAIEIGKDGAIGERFEVALGELGEEFGGAVVLLLGEEHGRLVVSG